MPSGRFAKDLVGARFGRLLVIARAPKRGAAVQWYCACDCGNFSRPSNAQLTWHGTVSCGCLRVEVISKPKQCLRCGEVKPSGDFYQLYKTQTARTPYCKPCTRIMKKEEYAANPIPFKYRARIRDRAERIGVLNAYGRQCVCCGESQEKFLAVDHKNGGGHKHRKELGRSGAPFYKWLRERGYPAEFQILCTNCNWGKHRNGGECPHVSDRFAAALSLPA